MQVIRSRIVYTAALQPSGAAIQFQDEGTDLGNNQADTVDFVGAGVTATRAADKVTVTIPGSSFADQNANLVYAGPATGPAAAPTFRSLVVADMPLTSNDSWAFENPDGLATFGVGGASPYSAIGLISTNLLLLQQGVNILNLDASGIALTILGDAGGIGHLVQGGTGGFLEYINPVATGNVLLSGGVSAINSWGKVGLTTHVSGILPVANGGTGSSSAAFWPLAGSASLSGTVQILGGGTADLLLGGTGGQELVSLNSAITTDLHIEVGNVADFLGQYSIVTTGTRQMETTVSLAGSYDIGIRMGGDVANGGFWTLTAAGASVNKKFTVQGFDSHTWKFGTNNFGYLFEGSAIVANRTLTFPLLTGNDTFVTEAFTQTLTNKTLGAGTVFSDIPTINDGITFTFNPNATVSGMNVGQHAGDISTIVNGNIWYNTSTSDLRTHKGSTTHLFITSTSGIASNRIPIGVSSTVITSSANLTFTTNRLSGTTLYLTLSGGTATAGTCPLVMTTGTLLTVAIAGGVEYNNTFHMTNSDATRRHVVLAPNTTKVTAGAPYANDGYVTLNIGGTDFNFMTTA